MVFGVTKTTFEGRALVSYCGIRYRSDQFDALYIKDLGFNPDTTLLTEDQKKQIKALKKSDLMFHLECVRDKPCNPSYSSSRFSEKYDSESETMVFAVKDYKSFYAPSRIFQGAVGSDICFSLEGVDYKLTAYESIHWSNTAWPCTKLEEYGRGLNDLVPCYDLNGSQFIRDACSRYEFDIRFNRAEKFAIRHQYLEPLKKDISEMESREENDFFGSSSKMLYEKKDELSKLEAKLNASGINLEERKDPISGLFPKKAHCWGNVELHEETGLKTIVLFAECAGLGKIDSLRIIERRHGPHILETNFIVNEKYYFWFASTKTDDHLTLNEVSFSMERGVLKIENLLASQRSFISDGSSVEKTQTTTTTVMPMVQITAHCDVGYGHRLTARGEGHPALSWEVGLPLKWADNKWVLDLDCEGIDPSKVQFKVMLDDKIWEKRSSNRILGGAQNLNFIPYFS